MDCLPVISRSELIVDTLSAARCSLYAVFLIRSNTDEASMLRRNGKLYPQKQRTGSHTNASKKEQQADF
ncbi:hypothetical protein D9M72_585520 [compost metagenome]